MPTGKVKFFDDAKGFGFIAGDDGEEVFLHASALPEGTVIKPGARLEYGVAEGRRGAQALSVRLLEPAVSAVRAQRRGADDMAVLVEDLMKLLESVGNDLRHGRYPQGQQARTVTTVLRKVADELDA